MLGETVACTTIPPHLYTLSHIQVQCYPPFWQLHSRFGNFSNGVCHVFMIAMAKSSHFWPTWRNFFPQLGPLRLMCRVRLVRG